jgi:hypothetical protein
MTLPVTLSASFRRSRGAERNERGQGMIPEMEEKGPDGFQGLKGYPM